MGGNDEIQHPHQKEAFGSWNLRSLDICSFLVDSPTQLSLYNRTDYLISGVSVLSSLYLFVVS